MAENQGRGGRSACSGLSTKLTPRPQLILPYLDVDLKYYDLGMESRDAVSDAFGHAC